MAEFQDNSPQVHQSPDNSHQGPDQSQDHHQAPQSGHDGSGDVDEIAAALEAVGADEFDGEDSGAGDAKGIPSEKRLESRPKEVTPPTPEPSDRVKPSALASFHRQQKEFFAEKQAFMAERQEAERIKGVLENAKVDRLAALEAMGYTDVKSFLEGLAEDGGRMTPERRELLELKKWRESEEKSRAEQQAAFQRQQQEAHQRAQLDGIRREVQNTIRSEDYSARLINLPDADEQVMLEMDAMAKETGRLPKVEDAIGRVEDKFRGFLEQMAENPEILAFFRERVGAPKLSSTVTPQSKTRAKSRTIGSEARNPGLRTVPTKRSELDEEDEVAEAIAWLHQNSR